VVVEAFLEDLEGRRHEEDGLAVLLGGGAAYREGAAVADGLDAEPDGFGRVAGAHEVAVQGVHEPVRGDGAPGGDQGLAGNLAAEDALGADLRADAFERGGVDLLQVENLEELVDGGLSEQRHL
jgi:hypothetical protein